MKFGTEIDVGLSSQRITSGIAELSTGISMYYEIRGSGEPVILIMGTSADHSPWNATAEAYSSRYRVITFDQRGTGQTDRPLDPTSYTTRTMAADVSALLDYLRISVCHVSGMSLGSAVAQEVTLGDPGRVASLQLHATWGRTDEWLRRMFESLLFLTERPDLSAYFQTDNMWISSASLLNQDPQAFTEAERAALVDPHAPTVTTLRGHLHADLNHDALDRLERIKVPTLITSGEMDWQVPTRYCVEVHERIAGSRLNVFTGPQASHNLFSEMAAEFQALTLEFVAANAVSD